MIRALVHGAADPALVRRTERALAALGLPALRCPDPASLAQALLQQAPGPAWLVRAGAWPIAPAFAPPPPSATGRPLLGLGARRHPDDGLLDGGWDALLGATGGDLERWPEGLDATADSVWAEAPGQLGVLVAEGRPLAAAARALARRGHRAVHVAALDVHHDPRLRVVQALPTLHRGGAERVALDLVEGLPGLATGGVAVLLAVMDRSSRATLTAPEDAVHLRGAAPDRAGRAAALAQLAVDFGADLVHAHLLDGEALRALAAAGLPVVVTLHNQRPGWPEGLADLEEGACALWAACSLAVRADAAAAGLRGPLRTAWNGVRPARRLEGEGEGAAGPALRRALGVPPGAKLLLSVANYRPQKRLEELPRVLAALAARGHEAHLALVGERERGPAAAAAAALRAAAEELGVAERIHEAGDQADVAPFHAAADALITASAHEGLSLAQLEALAAGLPVITTAVGGAAELARKHAAVRVVRGAPADAPADALAEATLEALEALASPENAPAPAPALAPDFLVPRMVERYADLYRRALAPPARPDGGLVLVTNNFSTGGAQSSARRLLLALAAAGVRVRAAVVEEQPEYPTPGREALLRAGVPVLAAPRAGAHDPRRAAEAIAALVDEEGAAAVLFWNLIPEHKLLLADLLLRVPVFDVSPGEMYFASLERYFRRPRPALPYLDPRDYGALLAGVVVKYQAEAARASEVLGAPVHVIPNGVVVPPAPPARPGGRSPLILGTLARLSPDKKLEQLLEATARAAPRLPPFELRIAGGVERGCDAYAADLRAHADAAGLPVRWVGEADAEAFLRDLDLFVMISEPAGCPNASLEAMASGLPVIATDVGGAAEQVAHGETGLLVGRGDTAAFAEAMVELARDEPRRRALGLASHRRAAARFDLRRMAADYARLCGVAPAGEPGQDDAGRSSP